MNRRLMLVCAKWLWVVAVLVFVSVYAFKNRFALLDAAAQLGWTSVAFSSLMIVLGKLGLVVNMQLACARFNIGLSFPDCYRIYNNTQLAKYVPGSIWQFVGRYAVLRDKGFAPHRIRDAMLAEHFWVLLVAAVVGAGALAASGGNSYLSEWMEGLALLEAAKRSQALLIIGVLVAGVGVIWLRKRLALGLKWLAGFAPSWQVWVALVLSWFALGGALWVTVLPFTEALPSLLYVTGAYGVAYVIGFVVPFAPAGLGVREAILVLALTPLVGLEISLLLATLNRVLYFLSELMLAAAGLQLGASGRA